MKTKKTSNKLTEADILTQVKQKFHIVGRETEITAISSAVLAERNVLIEGPVGVGKTVLAHAVASIMGRELIRVDGDSRFTEQKLTGWFDPSLVIKKGYTEKTFVEGPLVHAMKAGSILFINELNRMPEAVQNILLPAIDEGLVQIPQLGTVHAKEGFLVIATQNPREFVATSHLSEALMDRMEWVQLNYQSFEEEKEIARIASSYDGEPFLTWAVELIRLTRNHIKIKRGASIRAAIAILKIVKNKKYDNNEQAEAVFWSAAKLALPTRIEINTGEIEGHYEKQIELILKELFEQLKKNLRF